MKLVQWRDQRKNNPPTSYPEAKTLLKSKFRLDWTEKNNGYQSNKDNINKLKSPSSGSRQNTGPTE